MTKDLILGKYTVMQFNKNPKEQKPDKKINYYFVCPETPNYICSDYAKS